MYLGKKTWNALYIIDVISVILLITVLVGPELLGSSSVAEFLENCRGLMVYHCLIFAVVTALFKWFHAEISTEIKGLQNRMLELEENIMNEK